MSINKIGYAIIIDTIQNKKRLQLKLNEVTRLLRDKTRYEIDTRMSINKIGLRDRVDTRQNKKIKTKRLRECYEIDTRYIYI